MFKSFWLIPPLYFATTKKSIEYLSFTKDHKALEHFFWVELLVGQSFSEEHKYHEI